MQAVTGLFDGVINMVRFQVPPEQLHTGVEGQKGYYTTTLREIEGMQYLKDPKGGAPVADVPTRADQQTIQITAAATHIQTKLATDFGQHPTQFTSAEFALEMTKGSAAVEFLSTDGAAMPHRA